MINDWLHFVMLSPADLSDRDYRIVDFALSLNCFLAQFVMNYYYLNLKVNIDLSCNFFGKFFAT